MFNLFSRTEELDILLDYTVYTKYSPPVVTLKFIESLVPDTATRNYLLSWVKRKLTLFEYSPVVPYLLGAAGSGKDTFVNILRRFMGENTFAKPSAAEFCSQYNGWLESSYFVHLDEYGDQLSKHDKDIAKGRIKADPGSASAQIRRMNNDGYEVRHNATFIMTANKNALEFDIDDRRFFYIKTPAALASQDWVMAYGGVAAAVATIAKESKDFAYYLATEVAMLDATAYTTPLASAEKLDLIANSLPPLTRLAMFIKHRNWKSLEMLLLDYNVALNDIVDVRDRVYWEKLVEVSQAFFPNGASSNLLSRELSSLGIEKIRTSRLKAGKTVHAFYIDTAGLFAYSTDKVFTIKEDESYG
jgi:hypothetical protein